ncbi:MAG: DUF2190 family protein [Zoogloeaceae bacterium]|jgi:hypothetical protein|nr:DUF2190 family protein [Zoogloeaceae bacterium]
MQTEKIVLTTTVRAAAPLTRLRFVGFDGGLPAAGAAVLGVANTHYDMGEDAGVNVRGELLVEAAGAIDVGALVETNAEGRAVEAAANSTNVAVGRARDASAQGGDYIRVLI